MFSLHTFICLLTLILDVEGKIKEIPNEELFQEVTEPPYLLNEPEHTWQFVMYVTEQMKKLLEENKEMHLKLQIHDREMKEITTRVEILYDENKLLSKNNQFLSEAVIKIDAVNKHLLTQVENLAKENKELTGTLKDQAIDISALNKKFTKAQTGIMTEQSSRPTNDLVVEEIGDKISKRIVLHSDPDILNLVTTHGTEIHKLQTDVAALKNDSQTHNTDFQKLLTDVAALKNGSQASSTYLQKLQADIVALKNDKPKRELASTYVHWGRNNCSANGTELVYSGYAAGSDYQDSGAAANYICLSPDPLWGYYNDADNARAKVMGVEYELDGAIPDMIAFFHKNIHEEDAPCSVCRSPRPTVIMIPGRNQCYKGWTLEYKGYLVAGYYGHTSASEYVCLDDYPEAMPGGHTNQNGKLFYMVEGRCGSLRCPPYVEGRELTCVVCSK